jgi:hypothetical protein
MKRFLNKKNNFNVEKILEEKKGISYLNKNKFIEENEDCYNYIKNVLGEGLKETILSIRVTNIILDCFNRNTNDSKIKEIIEDFKKLEEINRLRDILAHTLESFDDSIIEKKFTINSEEIVEKIEKIIKYIYGSKVSNDVYHFYDDANQCLLDNF